MANPYAVLILGLSFLVSGVTGVAVPVTLARAEPANPSGVAVIIGNAEYEHRNVPAVDYAHRDAAAFRRYVVDVLGYDPDSVIDLHDASRRQLIDVFGSKGDPQGLLWSYLDPVGGSDVVVFYSGHGVPGPEGRGYLLPVDGDPNAAADDGYPLDLLYRNVGGLEEARLVRVYLEAGFSGGTHDGRQLVGDASPVFRPVSLPEDVGAKVTVLAAAGEKQVASWDEEARHGLFTRHLLDALHGGGDTDGDSLVTAAEAKRYLDRHMTRAARRQHRRVQQASLVGAVDAVLASADQDRGFPVRAELPARGEAVEVAEAAEAARDGSARAGEAVSERAAATELVPEAAEFANPHGVAVIIGNANYEHGDIPDVQFAHRDAQAFRRYVLDVLRYSPDNVLDLRDATRRQLDEALGISDASRSWLWRHLHPRQGSDVVVFYSGHGVPGTDGGRGYLLPVDADPNAAADDGYPIDRLYRNVGGLAEARLVRVYLDASFSGSSHSGGASARPAEVAGKVTALAAASHDEVASWDTEVRHGLFTHHLLDALYGAGDMDRDGRVTALELKAYLDDTMTRAARRKWARVQQASLIGRGDAVLARASAEGTFPSRPPLGAGSTATGTDQDQPQRSAVAPAEETALALSREQRILVQQGLASLGFDAGGEDGVFGHRTRAAIAGYQQRKGLPETGYLTGELRDALLALGAARQAEGSREGASVSAAGGAAPPVSWSLASVLPADVPILGTTGPDVAKRIGLVTGGAVEIRFFGAGELVGAFDVLEAVSSGTVDAGWSMPQYWTHEIPALHFFGSVPFGPEAKEYIAWLVEGGAEVMYQKLYAPHGIHAMHCGLQPPEGFGWFREEIHALEDLRGRRMRLFGIGAEVMKKLGVSAVSLPGSEVLPALRNGAIDAVEFSTPEIDERFDLYRGAKHYYFPGWLQQTGALELLVSSDRWQALGLVQQAQIEAVCHSSMMHSAGAGGAAQSAALQVLRELGVRFHRWPPDILKAMERAWSEVVSEKSASDVDFAEIADAYFDFREWYSEWHDFGYLR